MRGSSKLSKVQVTVDMIGCPTYVSNWNAHVVSVKGTSKIAPWAHSGWASRPASATRSGPVFGPGRASPVGGPTYQLNVPFRDLPEAIPSHDLHYVCNTEETVRPHGQTSARRLVLQEGTEVIVVK